ncbi:charged multivesicular body protein 4 [Nannochloropsis oceanica]
MNLFGKKKTAGPPPNPADAIIKLRGTMETLTKREAYIQKKMDIMIVEAKGKMARKDKSGALFALKKKKMYEAEVIKIQGAMMNLESQAMSLEGSATNMEVFGAMRKGAQAMGAMRGAMDVDKVDDLIDDIREEMDTATHISDAISTPLDGGLQSDDDLLAELDALVEEETEAKLTEVPASLPAKPAAATAATTAAAATAASEPFMPDLPAVPTNAPTVALGEEGIDEEELRALKELERSMAV